jgi:hypothetical protein
VSELVVPENATMAREIGVDVDGDGDIDNKAGQIASMIPFDRPYNEMVAENIQDGRFILLARLFVDEFPTDEVVSVLLLQGDDDPTHDATEDNLTGDGHARIHPDADSMLHLCGLLTGNYLETDPGQVVIPYPYVHPLTGSTVLVPLESALIISERTVDEIEMIDVMVGGGMTKETVWEIVIPAIADYLSDYVREDPLGTVGDYLRDSVDCYCDYTIEGCETIVNREDDCACWGGFQGQDDPNPAITATEMRCNAMFATALRPDLDMDYDGMPELLSVGIKISAIPVTIDN